MDVLPHTELHPLPDGEVRLLGAVRQVTGAATRVDLGGARDLVDCGVAQGRERAPFPEAAREADHLVLTHGHLDHIGHVPTLLEGGFSGPIWATPATLQIARLSLEDSLEMEGASRREVEGFLARFRALARPIAYDAPTALAPGATLAFREAGHILGSASVELESAASRVVLSGDLGRNDSPLLRDPNTAWSSRRAIDVVVLETTYGAREHAHGHDEIAASLERVLRDAIARRAKVLVPAFAIGRTQTLLWFLNQLVEAGRLPALPVVIDTPMGAAVTETYASFRKLFDKESLALLARGDDPLDFRDLFEVRSGRDSRRLLDAEGPMVIIAGSGMCTGGRIVGHLVRGLPRADTTVLFVGHQADGTPGRRIQEAARRGGTVSLDGEEVAVRARVETLAGLSAHADRKELAAWLGHLPAVRRVALHHGEVSAQDDFARWFAGRQGSRAAT